MERIKINLPTTFTFSTMLAVRITDLNYGGHVGNDSFFSLIHEARLQFLKQYGYSELSFAGMGLIMADAAIEFKKELSYGDTIKISVTADGFDKLGFDLFYQLEVEVEGKMIIAGKAKTGMRCFDYAIKKSVSVPPEAIEKLKN
jgi:acyl-CoA thioester hydrolase